MAPKKQKKPQKKSKVASKKKSKEATKKPPVLSASVPVDKLSGRMDATKKTASLKDVLEANGEEHLYNKIVELSVHVEENPPVIFGWQHVEEFVLAIETARALTGEPGGEPLPVDPLDLPEVVTVQNFKEAVLDYAKVKGAKVRLKTTCLPCTLAQSVDVGGRLRDLD